MNRLIEEQNEEKFLRLLKAQRIAYSIAKKFLIFDIISILIALSPSFLLAFDLNHANIIAVIGVFWTIISIFSQLFMERQARIGAVIQDEFDTMLFGLKWNHVLVGDKIETSSILSFSKKYKENDLTNWYSLEIPSSIHKEAAVLLAYKCNAVWGIGQRKQYIFFIKTMIVMYYGGMIGLSIYKNVGIFDIALWLAPSIPALVLGITTIKLHKGTIEACTKINKVVDKLYVEYKTNSTIPSDVELRQVQDLFFTQRLIPNKVPDWFYKLFKSRNSSISDETIKIMVNE